MEQKRITMSDVVIGEPLAWDVYDARNNLLLRKGHLIERTNQIETLAERGLFIDALHASPKEEPPPAPPTETPSALRLLNRANKRLEKLLFGLQTETGIEHKIAEVASVITSAVKINSDVALASILLNQLSGSYAVRHSIDTAIVSLLVARALKKSPEEMQTILCASMTMNVGMLRAQEHLQNKEGELSDKEKALIRAHPEEGIKLLKQAGVRNEAWLSCVLMHHENEDGSGYPLGKSAREILENAKIIAIADRYCARISSRNYRKALLPNAALRDILLSDKTTIDPLLAASFIRELGVFPTGTFVKLENGEVGVVTGKGPTTTTPIVHALIGPRGAPLSFPIKRETAKSLYAIREVLQESEAAIRFTMQHLWGAEAVA